MNRLPEPGNGAQDQPDDLLELYALDLLDGPDLDAVERLLESDPAARERLRELRGATAMLAFDLDPVEATPDLKERILQAARADLEARQSTSVQAQSASPVAPIALATARDDRSARSNWTSRLGWAAAAVLAVALVGSLVWNARLRDELDSRPPTIVFTVSGSEDAVGVTGEVLVVGDDGDAIVKLAGLPELERGKVYQVWLINGDTPDPDVTFIGDQTGLASVGVNGNVTDYQKLAITVEPTGGSLAPTTQPIIFSDLTTRS